MSPNLRVPPQAIDSEQYVLGALLVVPDKLAEVAAMLTPRDFYRGDHREIFEAMLALDEAGKPFDVFVVSEWFESRGARPEILSTLIDLAKSHWLATLVKAHAEIIADKARLRRLIDAGTEITASAFEPEGRTAAEIASDAMSAIAAIDSGTGDDESQGFAEVAKRWLVDLQARAELETAYGLQTPWSGYNALLQGLAPGDLAILAGRPGMGKSAVAINLTLHAARQGVRVLYFSLEMTGAAIVNRAVAAAGEVPLKWLRNPAGSDQDYWAETTRGVSATRKLPILFQEQASLTRQQVVHRAKRDHKREPLGLIIVDHLHIMQLPGKTRESVEIGDITRDLKALAKHCGCPVLALAQLNRSVESRPGKRPTMADLRESGNIEQDADSITFLLRDDYYAKQENRPSNHPGMLELIVAKNREGEGGSAWAEFVPMYGQVRDTDYRPAMNPVAPTQRRSFR